ncbi:transposase [Streptomyces luteolifulvus]|uniref:transposase n=1 Tax=Streptomyces luteolifulvus TaxID=2615112 RepID=UPI0017859722|nr:transposase [Streptomyces luteolifulvus]
MRRRQSSRRIVVEHANAEMRQCRPPQRYTGHRATYAETQLFCHTYGRGRGSAQMIPGWPYSFVADLEPGRTSWTALLDAVRLGSGDDETAVTATQLREMVERLRAAGHRPEGDLPVLIVLDAGYDVTRLAFLPADLPVELLGRMRSDRVSYFPPPPQPPGRIGRSPSVGSSNSRTRAPGPYLPTRPPARPAATVRPLPPPGTGCIRC